MHGQVVSMICNVNARLSACVQPLHLQKGLANSGRPSRAGHEWLNPKLEIGIVSVAIEVK
jgi:hypothetical protein